MSTRFATLAAGVALLASAGAASADELKAGVIQTVDLGAHTGIVFYRAEPQGYRLFAGIEPSPEGPATRYETMIAEGQRIVFTAPQTEGSEQAYFVVARKDGRVVVEQPGTN